MNEKTKIDLSQENRSIKANKIVIIGLVLAIFSILFIIVDLIIIETMIGFFIALVSIVLITKAKKQGATNVKAIRLSKILALITIIFKMITILLTFIFLASK